MKSFLLVELALQPTYEQPLLAWVRHTFPEVLTFDVDVQSSEQLQQYALRFLREASEAVVCIKAGEGALHQLMPLLEEVLHSGPDRLILLFGQQPRLQRMLAARSTLKYTLVEDEEAFKEAVQLYFAK